MADDWLLLRLPGTAFDAVHRHLTRAGRRCVRLSCKAAHVLTNDCTRGLRLSPGSCAGATSAPLASRFQRLVTLELNGYQDATPEEMALLLQLCGQPMHQVVTLKLPYNFHAGAAAYLAAMCLRTTSLCIGPGCSSGAPPTAVPEGVCSHLPRLQCLHISTINQYLDASVAVALAARCPKLRSLTAAVATQALPAIWTLTELTSLTMHVRHEKTAVHNLQGLSGLAKLAELQLVPQSMVHTMLEALGSDLWRHLTALTSLKLPDLPSAAACSSVTSVGVDAVRISTLRTLATGFPNVVALNATYLKVNGLAEECDPHSIALKHLTTLELGSVECEELHSALLCKVLPNLRSLTATVLECGICTRTLDVEALAGLQHLTHLGCIRGSVVSQADCLALAGLQQLQCLSLFIDARYCQGVPLMQHMQSLTLTLIDCTSADLALHMHSLASLPQLNNLQLRCDNRRICAQHTPHTIDEAFAVLTSAPSLAHLCLCPMPVDLRMTDARLAVLARCQTLRTIHIQGHCSVTPLACRLLVAQRLCAIPLTIEVQALCLTFDLNGEGGPSALMGDWHQEV